MKFRAYLTLLSLSIIAILAWRFDICHGASLETLSVSAQIVGGEFNYDVKSGDSLTRIGARFSVSTSVLAGANGLPLSARLQVGQALHIDNRHIETRQRSVLRRNIKTDWVVCSTFFRPNKIITEKEVMQ